MTPRRNRAALSLLALLPVLALPASTPARQVPSQPFPEPPGGTAVIRGRVTAADTGAPLRRARVTLSPVREQAGSRAVETDMNGGFEFSDLPAGRYTVKAAKGQFVPLEFGQRRAFEGGTAIDLAEGATLERIDLALPRGGVIEGRVLDDFGEPVSWVRVSAMRSSYREGRRSLLPVGRSVMTDDLGRYRLYGLPPGRYAVGTIAEMDFAREGHAFAPAYFRGTQDPAEADIVSVGLGGEIGGVDFHQPPGRLVRLSGTVSDSRGRSVAGALAGLVSLAGGTGQVMSLPVAADGRFEIANVAPGEYGLAASLVDPSTGARDMVMLPVSVASSDLDGFVLQIVPGGSIRGRVITDNGSLPPFSPAGLRVSARLVRSTIPTRMPSGGSVTEGWNFELQHAAGALRLGLHGLPPDWMLESVTVGGRDITDTPLAVHGTEDVRGVDIIITDQTSGMNGSVIDGSGNPVSDYTVVVFAEDEESWQWPSRFLATARPDQEGNFQVTKLPPATYRVIALEYLDVGAAEDPEFLESLRTHAERVAVGKGETVTLQLEVHRGASATGN